MLSKRFNIKMLASMIVIVVSLCVTAYAGIRSGSWSLNPADFRYDMSLYFTLADKSLEDLDTYEIAAFIDDECSGVAEKITFGEGESCLYMRIRSNTASGEDVEFRIRRKGSEESVLLKPIDGSGFVFKSDDRVGLPSDPVRFARFFNVEISAGEHGSVDFENGLYKEGTVLTIKAVPEEGYHFQEWSDSNTEATRVITVSGDLSLSASFEISNFKAFFKVGDEIIETLEVAYGSKVEAPDAPEKEGYTFDGWLEVPETMPAHDIEVVGSYTVNVYKAVFKIDGEVFTTLELAFGAKIMAPEAPAKEGYTFSGWSEYPETMPAKDIEVTGSYTVDVYKAVFKIDGEVFKTLEIEYGAEIEAPEVPAKEGYTFSGWTGIPDMMPAKNIEVTGSYTVNVYKAVFKIDGEVFKTLEVAFGAKVEAPEAPAKEGYTFSGWSEYPETMPAKDIEVTGAYNVNVYEVVFKIDGEIFKTLDVAYGAKVETPEAPTKDGYTFSGWTGVPEAMPAKNIEVTGTYTVNVYKAVFKIDGEVFKTLDVAYGAKVEAPDAPAKEGYTFSGWSEYPESMPAKDIEVAGSYTVNVYKAVFKIDGEIFQTIEVPYGNHIVAPEVPAKEGHTFIGWNDIPDQMPAHDVEFDGTYSLNYYIASFIIDDEVILTLEVAYGAEIVHPEVPQKTGFTFSEWIGMPETMPAHDIEVVGVYTRNVYKLTFMVDGEVYKEMEVEYEASIEAPEAPEKEGYTFVEWLDMSSTMPAADLVVSALYSVNSYKLTVYLDGEVYMEEEVDFGSEITIPDPELEEGWKFDGWSDIPEIMPAHDVEVFGTTSEENSVSALPFDDDCLLNVYNLNGVLLYKNITAAALKDKLDSGFYIINGRKVMFAK